MAKSNLKIVQEAIAILGYIPVSVAGRDRQAKSIKLVDGEWVTDIPTAGMSGYVRIKKTKPLVVATAKHIVANAGAIRAKLAAERARAAARMMD